MSEVPRPQKHERAVAPAPVVLVRTERQRPGRGHCSEELSGSSNSAWTSSQNKPLMNGSPKLSPHGIDRVISSSTSNCFTSSSSLSFSSSSSSSSKDLPDLSGTYSTSSSTTFFCSPSGALTRLAPTSSPLSNSFASGSDDRTPATSQSSKLPPSPSRVFKPYHPVTPLPYPTKTSPKKKKVTKRVQIPSVIVHSPLNSTVAGATKEKQTKNTAVRRSSPVKAKVPKSQRKSNEVCRILSEGEEADGQEEMEGEYYGSVGEEGNDDELCCKDEDDVYHLEANIVSGDGEDDDEEDEDSYLDPATLQMLERTKDLLQVTKACPKKHSSPKKKKKKSVKPPTQIKNVKNNKTNGGENSSLNVSDSINCNSQVQEKTKCRQVKKINKRCKEENGELEGHTQSLDIHDKTVLQEEEEEDRTLAKEGAAEKAQERTKEGKNKETNKEEEDAGCDSNDEDDRDTLGDDNESGRHVRNEEDSGDDQITHPEDIFKSSDSEADEESEKEKGQSAEASFAPKQQRRKKTRRRVSQMRVVDCEWENAIAKNILSLYTASLGSPTKGRDAKTGGLSSNNDTNTEKSVLANSEKGGSMLSSGACGGGERSQKRGTGSKVGGSAVSPSRRSVNKSWAHSRRRSDGSVEVNKPSFPKPIWFAGAGTVAALWCSLEEERNALRASPSSPFSPSKLHSSSKPSSPSSLPTKTGTSLAIAGSALCTHDFCVALRELETEGSFLSYISLIEKLLTSLTSVTGWQPMQVALWRQMVVAANAFVVRLVEEKKLTAALELLEKADSLLGPSVLIPVQYKKQLKAYLNDSYCYYYTARNKLNIALERIQKALNYHQGREEHTHIAKCLLHRSVILDRQKKHDKARRDLEEILKMVEEGVLEDKQGQGTSSQMVCMIAVCYHNLAVEYLRIGEYATALEMSENACRLAQLSLSYSNRWSKQFEYTRQQSSLATVTDMEWRNRHD